MADQLQASASQDVVLCCTPTLSLAAHIAVAGPARPWGLGATLESAFSALIPKGSFDQL
jgi:hypothetical protein